MTRSQNKRALPALKTVQTAGSLTSAASQDGGIAALIDESGLTLAAFSEEYQIPYRTVQDWHAGRRVPPAYVVKLLRLVIGGKYLQTREKF